MRLRQTLYVGLFAAAVLATGVLTAGAAEGDIIIVIKGGKFVPSEIPVPAGRKLKIIVLNQDAATAEFESTDFHREEVVEPNGEIAVFVGPLNAGTYEFFDDYHPNDRGHLVVK